MTKDEILKLIFKINEFGKKVFRKGYELGAYDEACAEKNGRSLVTFYPRDPDELADIVKKDHIALSQVKLDCMPVEYSLAFLFENSERKDFTGFEDWDLSNCTSLSSCFKDCKHFNVDIKKNKTLSKVKYLDHMLEGCTAFNQSLNGLDLRSAVDVSGMFAGCTAFSSAIGHIDLSNCVYADGMFLGCSLVNASFERVHMPKCIAAHSFFRGCVSFNSALPDFSGDGRDTDLDLGYFLDGCYSFNHCIPENYFSNIANAEGFFRDCKSLNNASLEDLDFSHVQNCIETFAGCTSLDQDFKYMNSFSVVGSRYGRMFMDTACMKQENLPLFIKKRDQARELCKREEELLPNTRKCGILSKKEFAAWNHARSGPFY